MNDIVVSKNGIIKLLKGLNSSKALGPDELFFQFLFQIILQHVYTFLSYLYNF